jgi:hypothetical protein
MERASGLYGDAFIACAELVGRAGAESFEFGYVNEEATTVEEAGWWASAAYRGAKLFVGDHRSPTGAAMALAERILRGATCRCGELVALSDEVRGCRWQLMGKHWQPGCDAPAIPVKGDRGDMAAIEAAATLAWLAEGGNRAQRRAAARGHSTVASERRRRNRGRR